MILRFSHTSELKITSWLMVFVMIFYSFGCQYYKAKPKPADEVLNIRNIGAIQKLFIVHSGADTYLLENITVDSLAIYGKLSLPKERVLYHPDAGKQLNKYNKRILNEVHIYLHTPVADISATSIPLTSIQEIIIVDKDTLKIIAVFVFGLVVAAAIVFVTVIIVMLMFKSSCPYVYAYDGEKYVFVGETFGGAIGQNLQRDDYIPLPGIQLVDGKYRIRISNELKEKQYTDVSKLLVVEHNQDQKVMLDAAGLPHLISEQKPPSRAVDYGGLDMLPTLEKLDNQRFYFNNENYSANGLVMTFDKQATSSKANLILTGKNTLYFDYIFGEFLAKFGMSYETWMDKQFAMPADERKQKVIDHQFPLSVYVKKNNEWQLVDRIFTVGPMADRTFCIPVDLAGIDASQFEIKIESGFMFWEMDYAAIDFSDEQQLFMQELMPTEAFGTGGKDWTSSLAAADGNYMSQEITGEVAEIVFSPIAPAPGKVQSVFLHSNGYYELIREFEGKPQITELLNFREPGYFSDYCRHRYLNMVDTKSDLSTLESN